MNCRAGWLPNTWHWNRHWKKPFPFAMQPVKQPTAFRQLGFERHASNWSQQLWAMQSPHAEPSLGQPGSPPQTPFTHAPLQHWALAPHIDPSGRHGWPHTPLLHDPLQH